MSRSVAFEWTVRACALRACALWLLAMPAVAMADVLEIDGSRAVWVVGGPAAPSALLATVMDGPPVGEISAISPAVTLVSHTAGPTPWRTRVRELSAKYDVSPALLEALVWQESRWNSGAVSPKGARGFAQLMPGTARDLGVNAFDPSSNLEGGARYLRAQLDTFGGDLEKALAAYNAGPHRVQRSDGVHRIRETQNYVSAILARLSAPVRR